MKNIQHTNGLTLSYTPSPSLRASSPSRARWTTRGFMRTCHAELVSASTPLITIYKNDEILNQVQDDNKMGFTLIELLVVVLIIGILAAVAVPQYQFAVMKSRVATIQPVLTSIKQAEETYYLANGEYTSSIKNLDVDLTQCPYDKNFGDIKICGDWMIDIISADAGLKANNIRGAYCPSVIKNTKEWTKCAYVSGDFMITVYLNYSSNPNKIICQYPHTPIGEKICNWINNQ